MTIKSITFWMISPLCSRVDLFLLKLGESSFFHWLPLVVVVTTYDEWWLSILIMMMIMVLMMVITMLRRVFLLPLTTSGDIKMMLIMIIMIILPSEEIFVFGHCTALSTWRDFLRIYVYIPNALQLLASHEKRSKEWDQ